MLGSLRRRRGLCSPGLVDLVIAGGLGEVISLALHRSVRGNMND